MYLLDTDICINLLRGRAAAARARLGELPPGATGVSTVTSAELLFGALHSDHPRDNAEIVMRFLSSFEQLAFEEFAAGQFARIKEDLTSRGMIISTMDMLIAATACASSSTLVTNNVREFERVEGLLIENWMA